MSHSRILKKNEGSLICSCLQVRPDEIYITIERDEDGRYVAECTDLPGCLSEGETIEETMENISEAIIGFPNPGLRLQGEKLKIPSIDRGSTSPSRSLSKNMREAS